MAKTCISCGAAATEVHGFTFVCDYCGTKNVEERYFVEYAAKLESTHAHPTLAVGLMALKSHDFGKAEKSLESYVNENSSDANGWIYLALTYASQIKPSNFLINFQKASNCLLEAEAISADAEIVGNGHAEVANRFLDHSLKSVRYYFDTALKKSLAFGDNQRGRNESAIEAQKGLSLIKDVFSLRPSSIALMAQVCCHAVMFCNLYKNKIGKVNSIEVEKDYFSSKLLDLHIKHEKIVDKVISDNDTHGGAIKASMDRRVIGKSVISSTPLFSVFDNLGLLWQMFFCVTLFDLGIYLFTSTVSENGDLPSSMTMGYLVIHLGIAYLLVKVLACDKGRAIWLLPVMALHVWFYLTGILASGSNELETIYEKYDTYISGIPELLILIKMFLVLRQGHIASSSQFDQKSTARNITIGFMAVLGIVVLIAIFIMPRIGEGSRTVSLPSQKPVPQAQTAPQVQAQPQTAQPQTSQDVEIKFNDGSVYLGKVNQGKPHGQGTMSFTSGDRYVGEFKNGLKDGRGTMIIANGNRYVGDFKNDGRDGRGTFTWVNGDRYVGEYKNNVRSGKGTTTWANGDSYVGEWKDGDRTGQGTFTWVNGDRHVGEWKNNDRTGQGTFTSANGDRYVGEWKNNEMIGQSTQSAKTTQTLSYPHGRYVGETLNGKAHGLGTYTSAQSGTVYKGEFIADTFTGVGTMTWTDGSQFYGKWQNDVGVSGTMTYANGSATNGVVRSGVFTPSASQSTAQQSTIVWNHNNSKMKIDMVNNTINIYYSQPRQAMLDAGAKPNDLLVNGTIQSNQITGTARIFAGRCGQFTYSITGNIFNNGREILLNGQAPVVNLSSCQVIKYVSDPLSFNVIQTNTQSNSQLSPSQANTNERRDMNYGDKIRACVQPGVSFVPLNRHDGSNPAAQYRVLLAPDGQISDVRLIKSSGLRNFDQAVESGIRRCTPFPRPSTGPYPTYIDINYNMYN